MGIEHLKIGENGKDHPITPNSVPGIFLEVGDTMYFLQYFRKQFWQHIIEFIKSSRTLPKDPRIFDERIWIIECEDDSIRDDG